MTPLSSKPELRVRLAEGPDIPKILGIAGHSPESSQWPAEEYARVIAAPPETRTEECNIVALDNFVAAFIVTRAVADEMEILNLAVTPQRRRQGIASSLLEHALAAASRTGARRAFLEVRESNSAALAFYARHGFTATGRRRTYYSAPVEDAIILSRILPPDANT